MGIEVLLGIWALVASVTALLFWNKANAASPPEALSSGANRGAALPAKTVPATSGSDEALKATEKKLAEVRSDLAAQKDKLVAKQKEVDELKELARTKARREGKKEQAAAAETEAKAKGPDPRDVEIQSLRKGMAALESQLNAVKRDAASAVAAETSSTQRSAAEVEGAKKAVETERQTRARLEDENASLKKTIDELRAAIKKVDARPDVPGTALNLKELATPVVQELARFFRKGEEFERLYTVAQSQLQLEKDRTLEIQRRYFAVCRELAVVAGAPANVAASVAVQAAEAVVDGEVKLTAKPAEGAAEGEATKKKRRRRRRRKIAGEPAEIAEGEEGDDGEEGDEHDDVEGDVAAADKPGNGDSGASAPA
jgi:myosin heavy subunit